MRGLVLLAVAACSGDVNGVTGDARPIDSSIDASPPIAAGCITDVSAGDHHFTCDGLAVDARVPAACAAPGGAGDGTNFGEQTCFSSSRAPSRNIPILFLMGRTDASVGYSTMQQIRDAAIQAYGATGPTVLEQDTTYTHNQWGPIETF